MQNLIEVQYEQTKQSTNTNELGMREMQAKAFDARNEQYLLLKAPPASGKSRALMFIGLDKLNNQGVKKAIVAVPEKSIGGSFQTTELSKYGFFSDWVLPNELNLCTPGGDGATGSKVKTFLEFLDSDEKIIVCTHATLRFACEQIDEEKFDDCLIAIDEFHHVAIGDDNILGSNLREIMNKSSAHVVAMTGSYFRGDNLAILTPEDEAKFHKVTYNYYEQLNGYTFLKSLGIGYHFYQGSYLDAIHEVLDTNKKTIIHIPSVNAGESTKDKHAEVDAILDVIGEVVNEDSETGILEVKSHDNGKILRIADLVDDVNLSRRDKAMAYLRSVKTPECIDIIIALGMAKEGFDWEFCEHALTIGYRGSLTEIIQIIGRCTRDSSNKTHAQFTNLVAEPDATSDDVNEAVNNMLKAITCSLLMEQVLAPSFKFKPKKKGEAPKKGEITIKGLKKPKTQLGKSILESDMNEVKATILQNAEMRNAMLGLKDKDYVNKVLTPKIIRERYPSLDEDDVQSIAQHHIASEAIRRAEKKQEGDQKFVKLANKFIKIEELDIDLIESVNPFQEAYEIISKSIDKKVLKAIQQAVVLKSTKMTLEEAESLFEKIEDFFEANGREPDVNSPEPFEVVLAKALAYLRRKEAELRDNG
ncbi:MAG: ATP-dependent helicase [Peredibacter sp.]|nr:ATP-dependent helicase [Peredibacter sp.]